MQEPDINNIASIMSYGQSAQNFLANVNACVVAETQKDNHGNITHLVKELRSFATDNDNVITEGKILYLNDLRERIQDCYTKVLMQAKTYEQLAMANEAYAGELTEYIDAAKRKQASRTGLSLYADTVLRKRTKDLTLSLTIANNFTAQIKLLEKQSNEMAIRLQNTLVTIVPLLNSQYIFEGNEAGIANTKQVIKKVIGSYARPL